MNKFLSVILVILSLTNLTILAESSENSDKTYVNLSVTESLEVAQDLLTARLVFAVEAQSAKEAQDKVNKIMTKVVEIAKAAPKIQFSTENYYVYQNNPSSTNKKTKTTYNASQAIIIKSISSKELLELAGTLQNIGLLMQGLNYSLSNSKLEEARDSLTASAIEKLKNKANFITKNLGKTESKLLEINIISDNQRAQVLPRIAMLSSSVDTPATTPVAEPGSTGVSLTITAKFAM